jgi:retinol-binding protein 3
MEIFLASARHITLIVALSSILAGQAIAQAAPNAPAEAAPAGSPTRVLRPQGLGAPMIASAPVSAAEKAQLVDNIVRELNDRYIFPDVAKRAGEALLAKMKSDSYASIVDAQSLATAISADLVALTKDAHVRLQYSPVAIPIAPPEKAPTEAQLAQEQLAARQANFGLERVERLPGNIGYIDIASFMLQRWPVRALLPH